MPFQIDEALHWTEHYARYGFAVLRGLVDPSLCDEAVAEVQRLFDDPRPLHEWDAARPGQKYTVLYPGQNALLERLFVDRRLESALAQLYGVDEATPLRTTYYSIWLNPFSAAARPSLRPLGHIDSGDPYRGLSVQIAIAGNESFSGNMTVFPGSHLPLHEHLLNNAALIGHGGAFPEVPRPLPAYEFVAEKGDVLLVHHLAFHSANPSHSPRRLPRLVVRVEVLRPEGVPQPAGPDGRRSAWARSFAAAG